MRHLRHFYPFSNIAGISTQKRLGLIFNSAAKLRRDQQTVLVSKRHLDVQAQMLAHSQKHRSRESHPISRAEHPPSPENIFRRSGSTSCAWKQQGTLFSTLPSRNLIRLREKHTYTRISFGTGHKRNFRSDTT